MGAHMHAGGTRHCGDAQLVHVTDAGMTRACCARFPMRRSMPEKMIACAGSSEYQYSRPSQPEGSNRATCLMRVVVSVSRSTVNSSHARPGSFISASRRSR